MNEAARLLELYVEQVDLGHLQVSGTIAILAIFYDRRIRGDTTEERLTHTLLDFLYPLFDMLFFVALLRVGLIYLVHHVLLWAFPVVGLGLLEGSSPMVVALVYIPVADLARTLSHLALHKVPALWHFHAVHHSQTVMNPMLAYRIHFMEAVPNYLVLGLFIVIIGGSTATFAWYAFFEVLWGYLLHSHLTLPIGRLDRLFVTPQFHRLHHSADPRHWDKNYAERFALFDVLLGTAQFDYDNVTAYGIPGVPEEADPTTDRRPLSLLSAWYELNVRPFRRLYQSFRE